MEALGLFFPSTANLDNRALPQDVKLHRPSQYWFLLSSQVFHLLPLAKNLCSTHTPYSEHTFFFGFRNMLKLILKLPLPRI